MNILSFLILILFTFYIKNINKSFYLLCIILILIINNVYYSENFKTTRLVLPKSTNQYSYEDIEDTPTFPISTFDDDTITNINFNNCLYRNQRDEILKSNYFNELESKYNNCFKKKNINDCNNTFCTNLVNNIEDDCTKYNQSKDECIKNSNCSYDNESNKCFDTLKREKICKINKNKCDFTNNLCTDSNQDECYYNESSNKCEPNLFVKKCEDIKSISQCHLQDNEFICNNLKDSDDCSLKSVEKCEENPSDNCKLKLYNDIYNYDGNNSNFIGCYNYNSLLEYLPNSEFIKIQNISFMDFTNKLNDDEYKIYNYYGFCKNNDNDLGIGIIFKFKNINSIFNSKINNLFCIKNSKFLGIENKFISIFKKKKQCVNNNNKCSWMKNDNNIPCEYYNEDDCVLNFKNCSYDKINNKCINKGFCYKKCSNINTKEYCDKEIYIDLQNSNCNQILNRESCDNNPLCDYNSTEQKCENKHFKQRCLWENNKCLNN